MSQTKTDKPRGTITKDPELRAMSKIAELLSGLLPDVRQRVVDWINAKYGTHNHPLHPANENPQP